MIDPRIAASRVEPSRRRQGARAFAAAIGGLEPLVELVCSWWESGDRSESALHARLDSAPHINAELASAARRALQRHSPSTDAEGAAAVAVATGISRAVSRGTASLAAFDAAYATCQYEWLVFMEELRRVTDASPDVRKAWTAVLAEVPSDVSAYLENTKDKERTASALREREEERGKRRLGTDAWRRVPDHIWIEPVAYVRLAALFQLDASAATKALALVPTHILRANLIDFVGKWLSEDRALLTEAIRSAELAYKNERWTSDTTLARLLLLMMRHMETLRHVVSPNDEENAELDAELRDWAKEMLTVLLQRKDGRRMALEFGVELVRRVRHVRRAGKREWSAERLCLDAFISGSLAPPFAVVEFKHAWEENDKAVSPSDSPAIHMSGLPYLVCASLVTPYADASDRQDKWSWYVDLLTRGDPDLKGDVNAHGGSEQFVFLAIGRNLPPGADGDVSTAWRDAWLKLYPQRDVAERTFEHDQLAPSIHLVRVGNYAAALVAADRSAAAQGLWREVFSCARRLLFGHSDGSRQLTKEVGLAFALAHRVFGADWPATIELTRDDLRASELLRVVAGYFMVQNGLAVEDVRAAFERNGCDLLSARDDLLGWKNAEGFGTEHDGIAIDVVTAPFFPTSAA